MKSPYQPTGKPNLVDKMPLKTKKIRTRKTGVSDHHVKYLDKDGYDWIVQVTKGEHFCLRRLAWYTKKRIGKGALIALAQFIADNIGRAVDLKKEEQ
jgi:hypothetical protein